jgi:glycine/D-amino acid oxidase-like deaminating enzyme
MPMKSQIRSDRSPRMARLHDASAYDAAIWPTSHWAATADPLPPCPPLTGTARADVAIVGAGYAGLNAALELVERHGADVAVLEAGQPGWGASGRNGGFACRGGAKLSPRAMQRRFGAEAAAEWAAFEAAAVDRVRDNLNRYAIDADPGPEGELCLAHAPRAARALAAGAAPGEEWLSPGALAERGLNAAGTHGGLMRPLGFPIHPLNYARGLARAAQAAGVRLHGDGPVTALGRAGGDWVLSTARGRIAAPRVLIATNGYSDEALPPFLSGRILPVLSAILVTRELTPAELDAQGWHSRIMAYDSRRVLHYFRLLPCGRFLFGGRGATSAAPAAQAAFHATLRADFEAMFPAFAPAGTAHYWSGLVCLTGSWTPFCGAVPGAPGLFAALGWHGNGVAAASEGGRRIAAALAGRANPAPAGDVMRILVTNDDGINAPGLAVLEEIAADIAGPEGRGLGGRPRVRAVGRRAQDQLHPPDDDRQAGARAASPPRAARPTACSPAITRCCRGPARPRALGRQPRQQLGRERDVFRHRRRRDGGRAAGPAGDRAVAVHGAAHRRDVDAFEPAAAHGIARSSARFWTRACGTRATTGCSTT